MQLLQFTIIPLLQWLMVHMFGMYAVMIQYSTMLMQQQIGRLLLITLTQVLHLMDRLMANGIQRVLLYSIILKQMQILTHVQYIITILDHGQQMEQVMIWPQQITI